MRFILPAHAPRKQGNRVNEPGHFELVCQLYAERYGPMEALEAEARVLPPPACGPPPDCPDLAALDAESFPPAPVPRRPRAAGLPRPFTRMGDHNMPERAHRAAPPPAPAPAGAARRPCRAAGGGRR
ncbi:hypothetical protein ABH927_002996 [Planotetraspora sp. GP83]